MNKRLLAYFLLVLTVTFVSCRQSQSIQEKKTFEDRKKQPFIYVYFPELDQRIEKLDTKDFKSVQKYYPDNWYSKTSTIIDFAIRQNKAYLLLSSKHDPKNNSLWVVDLNSQNILNKIKIPFASHKLKLFNDKLLICHLASKNSLGKLSWFSMGEKEKNALEQLDLNGACYDMHLGTNNIVYVLEQHTYSKLKITKTSNLLKVNLSKGKIVDTLALPSGSQHVSVVDNKIYVSHSSGSGNFETDGKVSLVDIDSWRIVKRIDMGMTIRNMKTYNNMLVLNLLSNNAQSWIAIIDKNQNVIFDVKLPFLLGHNIAVDRNFAYLLSGNKMMLVDLQEKTPIKIVDLGEKYDQPNYIRIDGYVSVDGYDRVDGYARIPKLSN